MANPFSYSHWKGDEKGAFWKPEKLAVALDVVGSDDIADCVTMRDKIVPHLQGRGYDVKYWDIADWEGPGVIVLPHLFFYDRDLHIYLQMLGIKTAPEIKKRMIDPDEV